MPLASTSTSYATLASTRPPSATLSRPPPRATTSGSTLNPSEPTKQSAAPKPAPSLRSSQLKSYLANKSHPKQPTKPAPKSQSHSKPMNPSSKPPTAVDVDGSSASRSSSSTSTSQRQSSKAATLDLKLKQIAALSAPMKRTRATLDASSSSSRATATASAIASSGGTSARPNKARKLNPPPAHQRQQSKAQRDKIRGGGSSRPTSSKPIPPPDPLAVSSRQANVSSSPNAPRPRQPPPSLQLADNSAPAPPPLAPAAITDAQASPLAATTPSSNDSLLKHQQELDTLRCQLASERTLRTATARDLLLLQAGVELMHSESAAKFTSLSTQLDHAHATISSLEAQLKEMHEALTKCNKQWQDVLFEELDKLEAQAHAGVKVAVARAVAAKREAGVWKRRAEAAEGMIKWYEKVVGPDQSNKANLEDTIKSKAKRRETWAAPGTASSAIGLYGQEEAKEKACNAACDVDEDKENAGHASIEEVGKSDKADVDKEKVKKSRRTVA